MAREIHFYVNPEDKVEGTYEPRHPKRSHFNDAGFDFYSPRDIYLQPGQCTVVDLGVIVSLEPYSECQRRRPRDRSQCSPTSVDLNIEEEVGNCWTMMMPRSSAGYKKGIFLLNTVGVIDRGFNGPSDRLMAVIGRRELTPAYGPYIRGSEKAMLDKIIDSNNSVEEPVIKKGERFLQLTLMQGFSIVQYSHNFLPDKESRGGFGSTGS